MYFWKKNVYFDLYFTEVCSSGKGFVPNRRPTITMQNQWWPRSPTPHGVIGLQWVNTLRPRQNGRHFTDDILKCIFSNENIYISIEMSLKFIPKSQINNIPALVQIMAWCRPGDKPFLPATKQLYEWYFLSVCPSVRLPVCHTFLTMFPSSYHHEIFRSYH